MPLTMRLKPGERLIVNGAVLRNSSSKPVELDVLNRVTTLHERDLMLPEQATTPLKMLYMQMQMMHLEPENHEKIYKEFIALSAQIYTSEMAKPESTVCDTISEMISLVGMRNFPTAMRRLQKLVGRPGAERQAKTAPTPR